LFAPSQAAVVGAATVLMASPAFAATIKLGGDNGELGFFVSGPSRRSRFSARAFVRARSPRHRNRRCQRAQRASSAL
jgi:hypothetical protein